MAIEGLQFSAALSLSSGTALLSFLFLKSCRGALIRFSRCIDYGLPLGRIVYAHPGGNRFGAQMRCDRAMEWVLPVRPVTDFERKRFREYPNGVDASNDREKRMRTARIKSDTRLVPSEIGTRRCAYSTVELKDRELGTRDLCPAVVVEHHNWRDPYVT